MSDSPLEMTKRLTEYVDELLDARILNKKLAIKGRTKMILNVLDKLRIAHQASPLSPDLIHRIEKDKKRAALNLIDLPVLSESKSERIKNILFSLYVKGIKWDCSENSNNWLILIEPKSKRRVKIEIDTSGYGTNSIPLEQLPDTLKLLAKKWNQPLNPNKLGEGTLTDCGWRANFPDEDRRAALDKAMSIHGKTRILRALKVTKISPWLSDYPKNLDHDIAYVSKGRMHLIRHPKYDRLIYVTLL